MIGSRTSDPSRPLFTSSGLPDRRRVLFLKKTQRQQERRESLSSSSLSPSSLSYHAIFERKGYNKHRQRYNHALADSRLDREREREESSLRYTTDTLGALAEDSNLYMTSRFIHLHRYSCYNDAENGGSSL
ncbi:Hypothetical predicted protein [Scomber scombrus]|uniref:Uncharacterized protein n=1 Tax=Scomber scombrus TaxID=13677 RepID=A0AAV1QJ88_SCOSC